jgi:hypothetical protein
MAVPEAASRNSLAYSTGTPEPSELFAKMSGKTLLLSYFCEQVWPEGQHVHGELSVAECV